MKGSYFEKLSALMNRFNEQMKSSGGNPDVMKECFEETSDQIVQNLEQCNLGLSRTQDLKVLLPKFSVSENGQILDETRPDGHNTHTFTDKLNRILIKDDAHYSKFKFERQTNFKPNLTNTLSIFENPAIYKKVLSMLSLISSMYQGKSLAMDSQEEEKKEEESKEATPLSQCTLDQALFSQDEISQFDYAGADAQQIALKLGSVNQLMTQIVKAYNALTQIVKTDG